MRLVFFVAFFLADAFTGVVLCAANRRYGTSWRPPRCGSTGQSGNAG